jgi:DNA-binding response OmpR family regulator
VGRQQLQVRVLVVASEPRLLEDVRTGLEAEHAEIQNATDETPLAHIVGEWKPHIAIVDTDQGQGEVVGELKSVHPDIAVIALTRATDLTGRLRPFQDGADDVLVFPFAAQELLARFRALLRRARVGKSQPGVLRAENLEINVLRRRATLDGVDLQLTPVEQSLLYFLASNAGRVLSRDQILDAVWGSRFSADSNLVDRHIRNLRTKLRDDWRAPKFILTLSRRGYEFTARTSSKPILEVDE